MYWSSGLVLPAMLGGAAHRRVPWGAGGPRWSTRACSHAHDGQLWPV